MKRRTFLKLCGSTAVSFYLLPENIKTFAQEKDSEYDKKLVVIELQGGNDGLNTLIPFSDNSYYKLRPNIAVSADSLIKLNEDFALHPDLEDLKGIWDQGNMAITLGVGYPDPDLSHFRSTDIWQGASTEEIIYTGWLGRYLDLINEGRTNFQYPPAIEIQSSSSLILKGKNISGMAISDPEMLFKIQEMLTDIPDLNENGTLMENEEILFVKGLQSEIDRYLNSIKTAWEKGDSGYNYPEYGLSMDLSAIARLIKGGLGTSIYVARLSGFDTHVNQLSTHPILLKELASSIKAFFEDISNMTDQNEVVIMTTSEFGRRVKDNGSGTDHGTASVHFVIGQPVKGGFYGEHPSLTDLDPSGNMKFKIDFRQMFASILTGHLGISNGQASEILLGGFDSISMFS